MLKIKKSWIVGRARIDFIEVAPPTEKELDIADWVAQHHDYDACVRYPICQIMPAY